jgi:hypothetical protein
MSNTVDSQIVEGLADFGRYRVQTLVQATANSTLTLTSSSVGYFIFTGTVAGQIVKLGNATTYQVGHTYLIHNDSTQRVTVQDNSGVTLVSIYSNYRAVIVLQDNTTAAGIWVYGSSTSTDSFWVFENGLLTWNDETGADLLIAQYGGLGSAYVRQMSANGSIAAPLPITNGQRLGGYGYYGYNSGGPNGMPSAEDLITASEDHTPTAWGGDREWNTIPNGTTTSLERMRLTNQGNLLIGTAADNLVDKLQVARGSSVNFPMLEMFDDFLWTTLGSGTNPYSVVSAITNGGAVTVETTATSNDYMGMIVASTGSSSSSGHAVIDFFNSVNKIRLGLKRIFFEARVEIPTLSTATQTFTVQAGLEDGNAAGLPANGVFFSYTHGTNGGQWVGVCRSGSTSSPTNSTVAVVANTWYVLRAEINAARTVVEYYIDGVLIGTNNASNIPGTTAGMRPMFQIDKSAGTSARTLAADYMYLKMFR